MNFFWIFSYGYVFFKTHCLSLILHSISISIPFPIFFTNTECVHLICVKQCQATTYTIAIIIYYTIQMEHNVENFF